MTIQELYDWAVENGCEDYEIQIQYADDGGYYYGFRDVDWPEANRVNETVEL